MRPLTDTTRVALEAGRRSSDAFVLRRCHIVLARARGERVPAMAHALSCDAQTVRNAIHAFNTTGVAALTPGSSVPHTIPAAFDPAAAERLRALLHRSPRVFGKETGVWTWDLAAEVSCATGLTAARVSGETIRATLARLGVGWRRATHWISSPDPEYAPKNSGGRSGITAAP